MRSSVLIRALVFVAALALSLAPRISGAEEPSYIKSFDGATAWFNAPAPLTLQDVRNKVVLVDFCDYTQLSTLHALPYFLDWYKKYGPTGLAIVSVQVPTFRFTSDSKNVGDAVKRLGITWPFAIDGKHAILDRYDASDFTPHLILFDHNGFRLTSIGGEVSYPQLESLIRTVMAAIHPEIVYPPPMALLPQDSYLKPNALNYPRTADILISADEAIANSPANLFGDSIEYYDTSPPHADGRFYLQGRWRKLKDDIVSAGVRGYVGLHYHAKEVAAVMATEHAAPAQVIVTQNGKPLSRDDAGSDIQYDAQGQSYVTVDAARSYDLVMNKRWGTYDLRLYVKSPGVALYAVNFESAQTGSDY